ncbi:tRNA (adenosine(37)-N6)-dimethylallyltransferase MiaA [Aeoliella mucimassa]|uniref:tRNA (adenosine(37)-N6)-dimethylallyltransferase MiaA n=1 Tax=Aeoliella mucimassa TaxID=2527972 RepID=UPI0018D3FFF4|nr:tRNA (adenosine(37)-N6)-dimethylallyltransferase MiaA [Aeoliella mucimassa]
MSHSFFLDECWFLTGATAVGKTRVGLDLAQRLGAEIVSLDSMAIYRGMDIGTAKPSREEQQVVPHHLIDVCDPADEYSVAQYLDAAEQVVRDIRSRGREALFVGGTPMWLKCLMRGFFEGPPADWQLREQIEREAAELAPGELHKRLVAVDPLAAEVIHPNDTRRIVRALEVFRSTGEPISHQQLEFEDARPAEECRVFVLHREREEQHRRIEDRVDQMLAAGLVDEVKQLTADGKQLGRTASQAVGYQEVLEYLAGECDEPTMIEKIKTRTRRFAKRQGTWFRGLSECRWIELVDDSTPASVAEQILAQFDA